MLWWAANGDNPGFKASRSRIHPRKITPREIQPISETNAVFKDRKAISIE
jgi:hypothetical protein